MAYGLKKIVKDKGRVTTIVSPKLLIVYNCSGYGQAKTTPYYLTVNGKLHRRFKTLKSAEKYVSSYKRKRKKALQQLLK